MKSDIDKWMSDNFVSDIMQSDHGSPRHRDSGKSEQIDALNTEENLINIINEEINEENQGDEGAQRGSNDELIQTKRLKWFQKQYRQEKESNEARSDMQNSSSRSPNRTDNLSAQLRPVVHIENNKKILDTV